MHEKSPLEGLNDDRLPTATDKTELVEIIQTDYTRYKHEYHQNLIQQFAKFFQRHARNDGLQFINDQLYLIHQLIKRMMIDNGCSDDDFKTNVTDLLKHWFNLQREQHNNLYVMATMMKQIHTLLPRPIMKRCRGPKAEQMMANFFLTEYVSNEFGIDDMSDNASTMSHKIIQIRRYLWDLQITQEMNNDITKCILQKIGHKLSDTNPEIEQEFNAFAERFTTRLFGDSKSKINYWPQKGRRINKRGKRRDRGGGADRVRKAKSSQDGEQPAEEDEESPEDGAHYAHDSPAVNPMEASLHRMGGFILDDRLLTETSKSELADIIQADYARYKDGYHHNPIQEFANFLQRHAHNDGLKFTNDQLYLIHQLIKRMISDNKVTWENFANKVPEFLKDWFNHQRQKHNDLYTVATMIMQIDKWQSRPITKRYRGPSASQLMANCFLTEYVNNEFGIDDLYDNGWTMEHKINALRRQWSDLGMADIMHDDMTNWVLRGIGHKLQQTNPEIEHKFNAFAERFTTDIFGRDKTSLTRMNYWPHEKGRRMTQFMRERRGRLQ